MRRLLLATTPFIIIFTFTFARQTGLAQGLKSDYESQELKIREEKQAFKDGMEARAIEIGQTQFSNAREIPKNVRDMYVIMHNVELFKVEAGSVYIYNLARALTRGNKQSGWRKEAVLGVKISSGEGSDYQSFQYEIESNMLCKYSQYAKHSESSNSYMPGDINKKCIRRADPQTIEAIQWVFVQYGSL